MSRSLRLSDGDREQMFKRLAEARQDFEDRSSVEIHVRAQRWGAKDDVTYELDVMMLQKNIYTREFSSRVAALSQAGAVADALAERLRAIDEQPPPESEAAE